MDTIKLDIFDETLRDGEQQAGIVFSSDRKYQLAHMIKAVGVPLIDIMPSIHVSEQSLLKKLLEQGFSNCLAPACLMSKADIENVIAMGVKKIIVFHACSDRLLFLRDKQIQSNESYRGKTVEDDIPSVELNKVRERALDKIESVLKGVCAKNSDLEIMFAAEDSTRADPDFLDEVIERLSPYLSSFLLCDTVGVTRPDRAGRWLSTLVDKFPHLSFGVHFHNDMGLALENTIQAVLSGASLVSGTFLGIGERAGNVALEQVLNGLRVRFGLEVYGIDYDALEELCAQMKEMGIRPSEPYSRQAQMHETGIHVSALIKDPRSYSSFRYEGFELCFGKFSGVSGLKFLLKEHLPIKLPAERYVDMRDNIKEMSINQQRCFSSSEVLELYKRGAI